MTTNKLKIELHKKGIEYVAVAARTINPVLIREAYDKKLSVSQIRFLAAYIADIELSERAIPKLIFNANRTKAKTWSKIEKPEHRNKVFFGKSGHHDLNVHSLIHELAHTITYPMLKKEYVMENGKYKKVLRTYKVRTKSGWRIIKKWKHVIRRENHHGRLFCIVQDYLLHEYASVWRNL